MYNFKTCEAPFNDVGLIYPNDVPDKIFNDPIDIKPQIIHDLNEWERVTCRLLNEIIIIYGDAP